MSYIDFFNPAVTQPPALPYRVWLPPLFPSVGWLCLWCASSYVVWSTSRQIYQTTGVARQFLFGITTTSTDSRLVESGDRCNWPTTDHRFADMPSAPERPRRLSCQMWPNLTYDVDGCNRKARNVLLASPVNEDLHSHGTEPLLQWSTPVRGRFQDIESMNALSCLMLSPQNLGLVDAVRRQLQGFGRGTVASPPSAFRI